jgi:hypothetical protein
MRKSVVKKLKQLEVKQAVQSSQSKPKPTGLSKSDPNYYSKIGKISAARRQMTSEEFSHMAKLSHVNRTEYHGGRPKKDASKNV